tara:strand:- start:608 stop:988 length:381 start_codon:yes stop_codon:yes gene_type:complete
MKNKKNIFSENHRSIPTAVYNVPDGYFESLNVEITKKIKDKSKFYGFDTFLKYAAAIVLLVGIYFTNSLMEQNTTVNYPELAASIDEFIIGDDQLFYTFVNLGENESFRYLDIDENIANYLEFDLY